MYKDRKSVCPQCRQSRDRYIAKLKRKAEKAYGKVSSDEYAKLKAESEVYIGLKDTLKEYLEIDQDDGILEVKYRAKCEADNCGFSYEHKANLSLLG